MEPAAAGRPVLFGPGTENFQDSASQLLAAGAGFRVADAASLSAALARLLADPEGCERSGAQGRALILRNRGAAGRTASSILGTLGLGRRP
jgi:3-deoxy-D-manno-octulosonic-acid transferase